MSRKLLILAIACSGMLLTCAAPDGGEAGIPREPVAPSPDSSVSELRGLSFDSFDQDMQGGWRSLSAEQDHHGAGVLIDAYLEANAGLLGWQRALLHFHAGQMYAYAGDVDLAVLRFGSSTVTDDVGPGWAPYVRATIAFLERDRAALDRAYAELVAAPQPGGPDPNIRVVESLRDHFEWDYQRAYEATRRP